MESSFDEGRVVFGQRETGLMARDPVCGMDVEIARAAASVDHEGRTHYFCTLLCREDFARQPATYLATDR